MTATTADMLTDEERAFVELVRSRPSSKLSWGEAWSTTGEPLWSRPEAQGLIEAVGSFKWRPLAKPSVKQDERNAASDLAFSVYSGINALRWLLNITTEFDRKDVRTRQAARLLDEYTDSFGKTNRDRLEAMWKTLNDSLPDDGRINEYLRAHDAAGRDGEPK